MSNTPNDDGMIAQARLDRLAKRFWLKVEKRGPDECWEWNAFRKPEGYGQLSLRGDRTVLAHRVAWDLTHGPIPEGLFVCHHCDNPPCVNPAHLFLGTNAENVRDSTGKGRHSRGAKNGRSKLTRDSVLEARARYAAGETQPALAAEFGVTSSVLSKAVRGKTWRHL